MLIAVAAYSVYTIFLRWKPPLDWRTLMAVPALGAMLSAIPLLIWESSQRRGRDGRTTRLAHHRLYRDLRLPAGAGPLHQGRGIDRRQPGRPVHQPRAGVRHAALGRPARREQLQTFHVIALALALGGIAIAEKGRPKATVANTPSARHAC
jgi:hypothetical protein